MKRGEKSVWNKEEKRVREKEIDIKIERGIYICVCMSVCYICVHT